MQFCKVKQFQNPGGKPLRFHAPHIRKTNHKTWELPPFSYRRYVPISGRSHPRTVVQSRELSIGTYLRCNPAIGTHHAARARELKVATKATKPRARGKRMASKYWQRTKLSSSISARPKGRYLIPNQSFILHTLSHSHRQQY